MLTQIIAENQLLDLGELLRSCLLLDFFCSVCSVDCNYNVVMEMNRSKKLVGIKACRLFLFCYIFVDISSTCNHNRCINNILINITYHF